MRTRWCILMGLVAMSLPARAPAAEDDADRPRNVLRTYTNRAQIHNVPLDMPKPQATRIEDLPDPYSTILSAPDMNASRPPSTLSPPPSRVPRERERKENWIQMTTPEGVNKPEKQEPSGWGWLADEVLRAGADAAVEADEQDDAQTNFVSRSTGPAASVTDQGTEKRAATSDESGAYGSPSYKPIVMGSIFDEPDKRAATDSENQDTAKQAQDMRPDAWVAGHDQPIQPYDNVVAVTTAQSMVDGGWRETQPWAPPDSSLAATPLTRQRIENMESRRPVEALDVSQRSGPIAAMISRPNFGQQSTAGLADSPLSSSLRSPGLAGGAEGGAASWSGFGGGNSFGALPSVGLEPAINTPTRDSPLLTPSSSRSLGGLGDEPPTRTRALPW